MFKRFRDILLRLITTRVAWPIVATIGLLCTASILALQLSSPERADRQQIHIAVGAAVVLLILMPHFQNFGRIAYALFGAVVVLLIAVYATAPINGARRWFQVTSSIQVQPSEIAKIAFVLTMAWYLRYRRNLDRISGLIIPFALMRDLKLAAGIIAERLGVPPSSLSFHLQELVHAGLIAQRRLSRNLIYSAEYRAMNDLVFYLTENCCGRGDACAPACNPEDAFATGD